VGIEFAPFEERTRYGAALTTRNRSRFAHRPATATTVALANGEKRCPGDGSVRACDARISEADSRCTLGVPTVSSTATEAGTQEVRSGEHYHYISLRQPGAQ